LPLTRRQTRTCSDSVTARRIAYMHRPFGCAHQLPLIGWPAIASLRLGALALAEARTTPCSRTKASASAAVVHVFMAPNVRHERQPRSVAFWMLALMRG